MEYHSPYDLFVHSPHMPSWHGA